MFSDKILAAFSIRDEKEDFDTAARNIGNGVVFRGTNLWILIFAIFIASLGLNVNSPAVIIGAMLISPLMGPILGIGLAVGINDLALLRKSFYNLTLAVLAALATSTVYFLLTPISEAHSELLARTSPNVYDVLIALFGGFACTLAIFSRNKGNVIPGAAIATALMPPICTAGYGIATGQAHFVLGALYLFVINMVFIATATLFTVRLLKFPHKHAVDQASAAKTQRIITLIIVLTLVPSVYFAYDIVRQSRFGQDANRFIEKEAALPNDYLLNKKVDAKKRSILLVYGGKAIADSQVAVLKSKLAYYDLTDAVLEVKQGFAYLESADRQAGNPQLAGLGAALDRRDALIDSLQARLDTLAGAGNTGAALLAELRIHYPALTECLYAPYISVAVNRPHEPAGLPLVALHFSKPLPAKERQKVTQWLRLRLKQERLRVVFD